MINVLLDENNYFTGNYATVGKIEGGVDVESLPPSENQTCYFLTTVEEIRQEEVEKVRYLKPTLVTEVDENGEENSVETYVEITKEEAENEDSVITEYVYNEDGTHQMETNTYTVEIKKWVFDESMKSEKAQEELSYVKKIKNEELNSACTEMIYSGIDVETTKGTEHFSLTDVDQLNIKALYDKAISGETSLLYHSDGNLCRIFTADEIKSLMSQVLFHVTFYTTLCNHLHVQVNNMRSIDRINEVNFSVSSLTDTYKDSFNQIVNSFGG